MQREIEKKPVKDNKIFDRGPRQTTISKLHLGIMQQHAGQYRAEVTASGNYSTDNICKIPTYAAR